jgi:Tol biopolymer transport system component
LESNIVAVPFDLDKLEVTGGPVPVIEGVRTAAVSDAGTLAYIQGASVGTAQPGRTLVWVNREGKEEPLGTPPNLYAHPKISPDGTRLAVAIGNLLIESDIRIWDVVRKTLTKLTFDKGREITPIWTSDGKRIVYFSDHEVANTGGVYWKPSDGTGEVEKLVSVPGREIHPFSCSGDGKILVMQEVVTQTNTDLVMLSLEGDRTRKPLLQTDHVEAMPKVSPDGRWMAYTSNESGNHEIYVRPFPEANKGKWQISTAGGISPLWSPDGRELFYLSEDNSAMAVAVETKPALSFGTPKLLYKSAYQGFSIGSGTPWDVHPDGKRFLMIKPPRSTGAAPAASGQPRITVVVNWFEELKQRVPVK